MKTLTIGTLTLLLVVPGALAIPRSFFGNGFFGPVIPATPRFGQNLTGDVLNLANWESGKLPGPWGESVAFAGRSSRRMTANPILFGAVPESVVAHSEAGTTREIAITYLDAGSFFGFKMGGERSYEERKAGDKRRAEFKGHYSKLERDLRKRLESGCGRGAVRSIGRSDALRCSATDFRWEDFVIRLAAREGHSLGLSIFRHGDQPLGYLDDEIAKLGTDGRADRLADSVTENQRGDVLVGELPVVQQGITPFCGIGSLSMVAQHLGLEVPAGALEAGAAFRNTGSARGSGILELYHAVAEELCMRLTPSSKFDPRRVQRSIDAGIPVVVWRRVTKDREAAHNLFAKRLAANSDAHLPEPTSGQRAAWPERKKQSIPSHGSVVTGFNAEHSEVIFTEPWGETARDRRMRVEEMEATAYAVFYFRFR